MNLLSDGDQTHSRVGTPRHALHCPAHLQRLQAACCTHLPEAHCAVVWAWGQKVKQTKYFGSSSSEHRSTWNNLSRFMARIWFMRGVKVCITQWRFLTVCCVWQQDPIHAGTQDKKQNKKKHPTLCWSSITSITATVPCDNSALLCGKKGLWKPGQVLKSSSSGCTTIRFSALPLGQQPPTAKSVSLWNFYTCMLRKCRKNKSSGPGWRVECNNSLNHNRFLSSERYGDGYSKAGTVPEAVAQRSVWHT